MHDKIPETKMYSTTKTTEAAAVSSCFLFRYGIMRDDHICSHPKMQEVIPNSATPRGARRGTRLLIDTFIFLCIRGKNKTDNLLCKNISILTHSVRQNETMERTRKIRTSNIIPELRTFRTLGPIS